MYLVKTIEKHLESLAAIQLNTCDDSSAEPRNVIVKPSTLKKLYKLLKKIRNDSIPDLTCSIYFYKQSIDKSCSLLYKIIGKHNVINLVEEFKKILNETEYNRSFEDCLQLLELFVSECHLQKLRKNGKQSTVLLGEIKLSISSAIKELEDSVVDNYEEFMKLEVATYKHILETLNTEDNWDIYKKPENYKRHSNLVNLLNAIILIQVKRDVGFSALITRLFGLFFKYHVPALDELMVIVTRKKDDYYNQDEDEGSDNSQFCRRYISMFDYFFRNSILGNLH